MTWVISNLICIYEKWLSLFNEWDVVRQKKSIEDFFCYETPRYSCMQKQMFTRQIKAVAKLYKHPEQRDIFMSVQVATTFWMGSDAFTVKASRSDAKHCRTTSCMKIKTNSDKVNATANRRTRSQQWRIQGVMFGATTSHKCLWYPVEWCPFLELIEA